LIAKIEDSEVNVSDYCMIRCNAKNKNTGSVVLYTEKKKSKYSEANVICDIFFDIYWL